MKGIKGITVTRQNMPDYRGLILVSSKLLLGIFKRVVCIVLALSLTNCSSPSKPSYQVNTLQKLSYLWIEQADKERQLENYLQAIELYQRGVNYARKRHDLRLASITMLKMAMSYLAIDNLKQAQVLVDEVKKVNQISKLNISIAITNVEAHLLLARDDHEAAIAKWSGLLVSEKLKQEQYIYYQLKIWNVAPDRIDSNLLKEMLESLKAKKQQGKLNNIEVLSYLYLSDLKWTMNKLIGTDGNRENLVSQKISAYLNHFAELEQTAKLKKIYRLAIDYYSSRNMSLEVSHYANLLEKLSAI
jgi:tetratricopeptide (TPR) repeat protein